MLRHDIQAEVARRGGLVWEAIGSRDQVQITAATLRRALPDISQRDVYICGPDQFTAQVAAECHRAGVPTNNIHFESFVF